jgi:hypothetical protein
VLTTVSISFSLYFFLLCVGEQFARDELLRHAVHRFLPESLRVPEKSLLRAEFNNFRLHKGFSLPDVRYLAEIWVGFSATNKHSRAPFGHSAPSLRPSYRCNRGAEFVPALGRTQSAEYIRSCGEKDGTVNYEDEGDDVQEAARDRSRSRSLVF